MLNHKPIILLVEDNQGDILLTKEAFDEAKLDIELIIACDGEEANNILLHKGEHIDSPKPDLILLDINLPRINGLELLSKIKSTSNLKRIPVIMLSSSSRQTDVIKSYDNHANGYLVKPDDLFSYIGLIRKIHDFWLSTILLANH